MLFFGEFVAQTLLFFLTFPLLTFLEEGILSSHIVCAWEGATGVFAWLNTWVMATTAQRSMTGPTPKKRYSYWTYFNGDFLGTSEGAKERFMKTTNTSWVGTAFLQQKILDANLISFAGDPGKVLHDREPEKCSDSELGPCHGTGSLAYYSLPSFSPFSIFSSCFEISFLLS